MSPAAARAAPAAMIRNVCAHDCPDRCSILSRVVDGRLVEVTGDPDHPVTKGFLCRKMRRFPSWIHSPERLRYPVERVGAKGSGRFRRVTWDHAIASIAERWRAIVAEDGAQAILPFYGSGNQGIVQGDLAGKRFFNRLGALGLDRTICSRAGRVGYEYTMGSSWGANANHTTPDFLADMGGGSAFNTNLVEVEKAPAEPLPEGRSGDG